MSGTVDTGSSCFLSLLNRGNQAYRARQANVLDIESRFGNVQDNPRRACSVPTMEQVQARRYRIDTRLRRSLRFHPL